jgi:hypothetical protein
MQRQFALGGVDGIGTDGHEVRCELQEQRASRDEDDTDQGVWRLVGKQLRGLFGDPTSSLNMGERLGSTSLGMSTQTRSRNLHSCSSVGRQCLQVVLFDDLASSNEKLS